MKYLERKNFSFASKALAGDTFEVVKFSGAEAISKPYEFAITLSAEDPDIDLKAVLRNPATLKIVREDEEIPIHGVPAVFEQLHEANHRIFYRAVLVPKLWYLGLYRENRLFLDKTVPQIIEETLKQAGLTTQDYELKFTRSYSPWEYVCQYRESNLDFLSRWMEREGIYYFFKQLDNSEKLVITDNSTVHENIQGDSTLSYSPVTGLIPEDEEVVSALVCRQRVLPKKVILKDYNYRKPSLEVEAEADVDVNGREEVYIYGEHFKDPSQGKELATIRAEEFLCRETMYFGEGTAPRLAPGFIFELAKHYRSSCNRKYLVTEVEHRGIGTGLLLAGIEQDQKQENTQPGYSNHFVCLPSDVQFRPERKTAKPRFNGTMNAVVDAAGDGSTAELDDQGRYKVTLPFDLSGRKGGKASRWIRMAQPYSGPDYGAHFPLHKGSEVLLTFIDGDLDRPIISGAVPNPETKSPVTNANQTKSIIRDNYGNEIIMDATPGDEHIRIRSPHHNSIIDLGRSHSTSTTSDTYLAQEGSFFEATAGAKYEGVAGLKVEVDLGLNTEITGGLKYEAKLGGMYEFDGGHEWAYHWGRKNEFATEDSNKISSKDSLISAGDTLCLVGGAGKETTSIIRIASDEGAADKGGITLAVGEKQEVTEPKLGTSAYVLGTITPLTAAVALTLTTLAGRFDTEEGPWIGLGIGAGITQALSATAALFFALAMAKKEIKVPEHEKPHSKIEMGPKGQVLIGSFPEEESNRKIEIRVGKLQPIPSAPKGKAPEFSEIIDSYVRVVPGGIQIQVGAKPAKSGIYLKKSGELSAYSEKDFTVDARGDLHLKSRGRGGVVLYGDKLRPLVNTKIDWPNLQVT